MQGSEVPCSIIEVPGCDFGTVIFDLRAKGWLHRSALVRGGFLHAGDLLLRQWRVVVATVLVGRVIIRTLYSFVVAAVVLESELLGWW